MTDSPFSLTKGIRPPLLITVVTLVMSTVTAVCYDFALVNSHGCCGMIGREVDTQS